MSRNRSKEVRTRKQPGEAGEIGAPPNAPIPAERATRFVCRHFPDRPVVAVGGIITRRRKTGGTVEALVVRRGKAPREGEWSIPGGAVEAGETLVAAVKRELAEETGVEVRVRDLIEVFERIDLEAGAVNARLPAELERPAPRADAAGNAEASSAAEGARSGTVSRARFHYVVLDYLCDWVSGEARPASDVADARWVTEPELRRLPLADAARDAITKAFRSARKNYAKT